MTYERNYYVYMLTNKRNGTLYIGITHDLELRIQQHKQGIGSKFTRKYALNTLVYYEGYQCVADAIYREKILKKWKRVWKMRLIEEVNPLWNDLSLGWTGSLPPQG